MLAAAAAVCGAAPLPRAAFVAERVDVVVIGAGLAGLNAVLLLADREMNVVALEAVGRAGGWMRTIATIDGPLNTCASQIGRSYAPVLASPFTMLREMAIGDVPAGPAARAVAAMPSA